MYNIVKHFYIGELCFATPGRSGDKSEGEHMDCPECGEPLEKRTFARNQRHTSNRWMCHNPACSVIFVEDRGHGRELKIVKDAIMAKRS